MMSAENFNPIETQLLTGINLIEASAGTGKTYAIAMLVLRFVVEQGLKIEQILVVTFTKAATEELKDRIRARLAEAKRAANGRKENIDGNVLAWLESLQLSPALIAQRLEAALLNIDQASIFTIHGFCQRILTEHALESEQLFDVELTGEINAIKQFCADDFWRREVYSRSLDEVSILTYSYKTPDALLESVNKVSVFAAITPDYQALNPALEKFAQLTELAKKQYPNLIAMLTAAFADGKFKESFQQEITELKPTFETWLGRDAKSCVSTAMPDLKNLILFSFDGIKDGLNGQKFRAAKGQSGDERKTAYLEELALDNSAFDELPDLVQEIALTFRRALVEDLRSSVDLRLQELNLMSFDDLIFRLSQAVENDTQKLLTAALQQRFQVALIDEFQDTDQQQWAIFSSLFQSPEHFLYLIGDPKQAIYKFRGADIFSYFSAQQQAQHTFTLGKNWRSHPQLVEGVNALFQRNLPFHFDKPDFNDVAPARKTEEGTLQYKSENLAPLMLWQLAESDSENGYWTSGKAATEIKKAVVSEIVSLLNEDFGIAKDLPDFKNQKGLKPHNLAILVRTNKQAFEYQTALQKAGVPAVLNSIDSVYSSPQAQELYKVLQAVANPAETALLKQALSLDWFGLDGQGFYRLIGNENKLDAWSARFGDYHQTWQTQGLMAMMQKLLATEKVFKNLSASPLAERLLTNISHLIELLQQETEQQHLGIHKTVSFLAQAINPPENGSADEQQLRLESDAQAVKIVTMHRSKGLEYDVVFCPVLWQTNDFLKTRESELIVCHDEANGKMLTDLGSPDFETHRLQALQEQQAEDLRVFYVAATRAKYRLYLVWANVRSKENPNNSAMAYLLDFATASFADQQAKLQRFTNEQPEVFDCRLLETPQQVTERYQTPKSDVELKVRERKRNFYSNWTMSSYTALASLTIENQPEMPLDKAQEPEEIKTGNEAVLALPKGSHTGNVIHNLLEFNSFKNLANPEHDITIQRDKTCARFGLKIEQPEIINQLLQTTVNTPLSINDESFCLKNLEPWQCLKEMPFYLQIDSLKINQLNALLKDCPAFQPLTEKQLSGFLTGFIDLICEYQGQYFVMDYKTNWLENYHPDNLTAAMREHNYGLQYWLYSVVLHLYLQNRLPNYEYEKHFGGVRYLFVRGMQPDVPMSGVYADRPDSNRINALVTIFGTQTPHR